MITELKLVLIPLVVALLTQAAKFLGASVRHRKFHFPMLLQYGGMPSGHTAFVVSLLTVIGLAEGINSAVFAIAAALAIVVIRDAVSFRQYLSRYGQALNILLREHPERSRAEIPQGLEERLGHTPAQAVVGGLIGLGLSLLLYNLLP